MKPLADMGAARAAKIQGVVTNPLSSIPLLGGLT
jgi:hypothetical protein